MGAPSVVVSSYPARIVCRCRWPKISNRSVTSVRLLARIFPHKRSRPGSGADLHRLDTSTSQDRVKRRVSCPARGDA
jgi:hypothetical protein